MNLLPIVRRELLVRARLPSTYWGRLATAALGMLSCLPFLLVANPNSGTGGKALFESLVAGAFLVSCSVCLLSANSVNREHQEGTLGLLLMTRVQAVDLLLGKLGGVGLLAFCALVSLCPIFVLPVLAGGVTGQEAFRKALALLNSLLLATAVGLNAAAGKQRMLITARNALGVMLLIVLVPLWPWVAAPAPWTFFGLLSPMVAVISGSENAYSRSGMAPYYWGCLLAVQAETWLLLLGAAKRLRGALRPPALGATASRRLPLSAAAVEERRKRWAVGQTAVSPVEWLVSSQAGVNVAFWAAAFMVTFQQTLMVPLLANLMRPSRALSMVTQIPSFVIGLLSASLIAWGASNFFVDQRRTGQLELLLTTPAGSREILSGQLAALARLLRWPVVLMLLPLLARFVSGIARFGQLPVVVAYDPLLAIIGVVHLYLSIVALCWAGLFFGFRAPGYASAVAWSVALARGAPYLISLVLWLITVPGLRMFMGTRGYALIPLLPMVALCLFYIWLIYWARSKLRVALAQRATQNSIGSQFGFQLKTVARIVGKARRWPAE